jgi:hypothetical protein
LKTVVRFSFFLGSLLYSGIGNCVRLGGRCADKV